jgi:hypothetical protein
MWTIVFGILSKGLAVLNKLLPSWEWKGGQAWADAKVAKEAKRVLEKQLKIASKPDATRDELLERMRKRKRDG